MLHKAGGTTPANFPEKMEMAAAAPVKIGTRGTVGSLVMKEIEYFSKLELERGGTSRKPQTGVVDIIGSSTPTRKKRRGSWFLLPNMCSAVEVSRSHRLNGLAPGLSYRTLKSGKP